MLTVPHQGYSLAAAGTAAFGDAAIVRDVGIDDVG